MTTKQGAPSAESENRNWFADRAELFAMAWLVFGFVLIIVAMMLGIDSVTFTGRFGVPELQNSPIDLGNVTSKQVGYAWAINWSVYGVLVLPMIILFGLLSLRQIEPTLRQIAKRGMVRDIETLQPVSAADLLAQWRRGDTAWRIIGAIAFILGTFFIGYEGWKVVSDPIGNPSILIGKQLDDPAYEYDWSVSCLFEGSAVQCEPLRYFAMIGYALVPGVSTVLALIVGVVALRFMAFIASAGNRRGTWLVALDPKDRSQSRFGWGAFEGFFSYLLYWAIMVLSGLWLMVVQNSFLRDPNSSNVFQMIFADSSDALAVLNPDTFLRTIVNEGSATTLSRVYSWLFAEPSQFFFANWQTGIGVILFGFVCASSVIGSWWLLRSTAKKSQVIALENLVKFAGEAGLEEKAFKKRVKRMKFWPVAWIDQLPLFGLMLLLFGSLFSYRLILVVLALVVFATVFTMLMSVQKQLANMVSRDRDDDDE